MSKSKLMWLAVALALVLPLPASAQNGPRGTYAERTVRGAYTIAASNQALTAADSLLNVQAEASRGFRIEKLCIAPGSATAATWTLWQLIRTTTAPSGGNTITTEVTSGNNAVAKMFSEDPNWTGLVMTTDGTTTEGNSGAILDTGTIFVNATATPPTAIAPYCVEYCTNSSMCPTVNPGVANGVTVMFTGTAGGVAASATLYIVAE